jgi:hypothetical protein
LILAGNIGALDMNLDRQSRHVISDIFVASIQDALRNTYGNSRITAVCWPTSVPERKQMAKTKEKTNKSALIREALKAHKGKSPLEISAVLKSEKGIDVPASYISTVKFNLKGKKKARKLSKQAAGTAGDGAALFAAAELVVKAGGVAQAQAALDAVKKVAAIMV